MDIRIEKEKGHPRPVYQKGIPYLAGALFLVFVLWLLLRDNSSTLRVDARTISVGQVVRGEFNDYIRVTGQVQPMTTIQRSPLEAGIVERLVVEEGTSVKKGDVLVVLSNTSLTLENPEQRGRPCREAEYPAQHHYLDGAGETLVAPGQGAAGSRRVAQEAGLAAERGSFTGTP